MFKKLIMVAFICVTLGGFAFAGGGNGGTPDVGRSSLSSTK